MQDFDKDKKELELKRHILTKAISTVIKKLVSQSGKSLSALEREYDIGGGVLSRLINGKVDLRFTNMWKLANALQIEPILFTQLLIKELPKDFNFFEQ